MKTCANTNCNKQFSSWLKIGTKFHNLNNRRFCLTCSPFKQHNTRDITKPKSIRIPGAYADVKKFRKRKKVKAVEYLGGKCQICSYNKSPFVLEFHHKDPSQKDFGISSKSAWGFERIKCELDKCALLCPNCHREVHLGIVTI